MDFDWNKWLINIKIEQTIKNRENYFDNENYFLRRAKTDGRYARWIYIETTVDISVVNLDKLMGNIMEINLENDLIITNDWMICWIG